MSDYFRREPSTLSKIFAWFVDIGLWLTVIFILAAPVAFIIVFFNLDKICLNLK